MGLLRLPQAERVAVFRAIVQILRNDPILSAVKTTFIAWTGDPRDTRPLAYADAPALRLTPFGGPDVWKSPQTMIGTLFINVEMVTAGTDVDDPVNLWKAIQAAIYAPTQASYQANLAILQAAGGYEATPRFSIPQFVPDIDNNLVSGVGQITIEVQTRLEFRGFAV